MGGAARSGPLSGVRVLEMSSQGPGPFAGMLLGDLGADVVRVDRPVDNVAFPHDKDVLRRSHRSVVLDVRDPRGVDALMSLVSEADVLIEGYRPGVAERLGIGPAACHAVNPGLVYGRMTGWGQNGPLSQTAGHDVNYVALSGVLHAIGPADGDPVLPVNLLGDFAGGSLYLVVGVLAALHERARSGLGQVIDAAIVDGAAHLGSLLHGMLASGAWRDERGVNLLDGGVPWYAVYRTSDGGHMAVGALEDKFFAELAPRLGIDPDEHPRGVESCWATLRAEMEVTFASRTRAEWEHVFADTDACVTPVLGLAEATCHPHMVARNAFVKVEGLVQPAPAPRFDRTPGAVANPPCLPGEHTREVLSEWAGLSSDALLEAGVAVQVAR